MIPGRQNIGGLSTANSMVPPLPDLASAALGGSTYGGSTNDPLRFAELLQAPQQIAGGTTSGATEEVSGVLAARSPAQATADRERLANQHSVVAGDASEDPLRDAFRDFVGQTLFGQLLSSMRSTVGKPAYFHGGRAEEVFSQQLDQVLVERISEASASTVADPMYDLFVMQRNP